MVEDPRPDFSVALDALLLDICGRVPELRHVDPHGVLVVGAEARELSRATIRPLCPPSGVTLLGARRRYEVALRPLFFLQSNGLGRLITLFHELFHIAPAGDGTLDEGRRHAAGGMFDHTMELLARAYADTARPALLAPLGHHGEVLIRQWRVRPGATPGAHGVSDADLYVGPVMMVTPQDQRSSGW